MTISQTVVHPNVAVVYDGLTGTIRRKIVPGNATTAPIVLGAGENFLILRIPPFDDASCAKAVSAIVGSRQ